MSRELPNWLDEFVLQSFGSYDVMNQQDFVQKVKEEQSLNQQNSINDVFRDESQKSNAVGINDQTGDRFEVVVNKVNKNKNDKGLQVEFSSGMYKDKYICSSIDDFCNGKYSHLKNLPIKSIAKEIARDNDYIFNYIETSIASNSESISVETAIDITNRIMKNSSLIESDHKKICSKLNCEDLNLYNTYLSNSNIRITKNSLELQYYIDYIKNFKEYKLASNNVKNSLSLLSKRIISIDKFSNIKKELIQEFKKDPILSRINFGE